MSGTDYASLVRAGIAHLDENAGPDWRSKIDLGLLDLGDRFSCVLTQVFAHNIYDDFTSILISLHMSLERAAELGFFLTDEGDDYIDCIDDTYFELTEAWVSALSE